MTDEPNRARPDYSRMLRFAAGMFYLIVVAIFAAGTTGQPFWAVLAGIVAGALACTGLALVIVTRRVLRDDARPGQFGIGSFLLVMVIVGMYLGAVRWLSVHQTHPVDPSPFWSFVFAGATCLFFALVAIPFLLLLADSLIWLAVWLVRLGPVRRWLRRKR